jgi:hypothetical protein
MRLFVLLIAMALAACTSHGGVRELTAKELSAVHSAEAFVSRHGYTAAGHPPHLPVENVEVLDPLASREDLVKWRHGTMESKAFGIAKAAPSVSWILFHRPGEPDELRAVRVEETTAVQVVHSRLALEELDWVRVPAH